MHSFRMASVVPAAPEAVWARATTLAGVNAELYPVARMTGDGEIAEGSLGRSWILALGVLPIDDFTLARMKKEKLLAKDRLARMLARTRH